MQNGLPISGDKTRHLPGIDAMDKGFVAFGGLNESCA